VTQKRRGKAFSFIESIPIAASPSQVWEHLADIEKWWLPSNPEHIAIEVRSSGRSVCTGTEVVFEERVAGIKGQATGSITRWFSEREAAWEGVAMYRYLEIAIRIREGVSWLIEEHGETSTLSARVQAEVPSTVFGRFFEWYAKQVLHVVELDREHAHRELEYLKGATEGSA
jgi:hypothetical protein